MSRPDSLRHLTEVSRYVYEAANMNFRNGQPFVGPSAFAHKGGMHTHAVARNTAPGCSIGNLASRPRCPTRSDRALADA